MVASSARRIKSNSGFTLIELLIAASLLMFVLVLSMYAYQLFEQQWRRNLSDIELSLNKARRFDMFSEALQGIEPYLVNSPDADTAAFYFLGRANGFTAVTSSPIINVGHYAVIRVFTEQSENGYQLVYEEASLKDTFLLSPGQTLPFSERLIIAQDVAQISYSYGVLQPQTQSASDQEFSDAQMLMFWLDEYDGLVKKNHPVQIVINFAGFPLYAKVAQRHSVLSNRAAKEFF